jgi:hypothetical protein
MKIRGKQSLTLSELFSIDRSCCGASIKIMKPPSNLVGGLSRISAVYARFTKTRFTV